MNDPPLDPAYFGPEEASRYYADLCNFTDVSDEDVTAATKIIDDTYEFTGNQMTIKPCPFCGCGDVSIEKGRDARGRRMPKAHCLDCGVELTCGVFVSGHSDEETLVTLRDYWNRRADNGHACLVKTLEDVISRIENSEHWWMDEPERGGFNVDYLKAVVKAAGGRTKDDN